MPQDPRDPRDERPGDDRPDEERHDDGSGDRSRAAGDAGHGGDADDRSGRRPGPPSEPFEPSDASEDDPGSAIPDDLSSLSPEDIPDDLSGLDLGGLPEPPIEPSSPDPDPPRGGPHGPLEGDGWRETGDAGDDEAAAPGPVPTGGPVDPRTPRQRLRDRYVDIRVATMERDGGPGAVLRWSARAPLVSTLLLALLTGGVLIATFGVPPVSPLFLIPVLCGPVYPWLRLESNAQAAWRDRNPDAG